MIDPQQFRTAPAFCLAFLMVDCLRDGFARFLDSPLSQKSTGEHRNANACAATKNVSIIENSAQEATRLERFQTCLDDSKCS